MKISQSISYGTATRLASLPGSWYWRQCTGTVSHNPVSWQRGQPHTDTALRVQPCCSRWYCRLRPLPHLISLWSNPVHTTNSFDFASTKHRNSLKLGNIIAEDLYTLQGRHLKDINISFCGGGESLREPLLCITREFALSDLGHFGRTAKKSISTQENDTPHLNRGKSDGIVHEKRLEKVDLWHQQSQYCVCSLRKCILRAEGRYVFVHGYGSNGIQSCRRDLL